MIDKKGRFLCESCGKQIKIKELGGILSPKKNGDKPRLYHKSVFCAFKLVDDMEELEKEKVGD